MAIDMTGEMRLNRQYGRYSTVATFRTVACVIPHEFHGIRTETTVALSSTLRLRSLLSYPLSLNNFLYKLDVRMMERYWSPVIILAKIPVPTVEPTMLTLRLIYLVRRSVRLCSMPLPTKVPPTVTAQKISVEHTGHPSRCDQFIQGFVACWNGCLVIICEQKSLESALKGKS